MGHFVNGATVRLDLSDGAFVIIKKRLNHGELDDMWARMVPHQTPGQPIQLDTREVRTARVLAYLVGWSLTDGEEPGQGQPVPMSPQLPEAERISTIRNLDPDTFREMHAAILAHEAAEDDVRARQKKTGGTRAPDATSPSPSAAAGRSGLSVS